MIADAEEASPDDPRDLEKERRTRQNNRGGDAIDDLHLLVEAG